MLPDLSCAFVDLEAITDVLQVWMDLINVTQCVARMIETPTDSVCETPSNISGWGVNPPR